MTEKHMEAVARVKALVELHHEMEHLQVSLVMIKQPLLAAMGHLRGRLGVVLSELERLYPVLDDLPPEARERLHSALAAFRLDPDDAEPQPEGDTDE